MTKIRNKIKIVTITTKKLKYIKNKVINKKYSNSII